MRALVLDASELAASRAALDIDRRDEMWDGVLHMVPAASDRHQRLQADVLRWLWPFADAACLVITTDTGLYLAENNWKVPDLVVSGEAHRTERGAEVGTELVIEIRSPGDETLEKIDFYAQAGVGEFVVIDRDTCELRRSQLDDQQTPRRLVPNPKGATDVVPITLLGVEIRRVELPAGPWVEINRL